MARRDQASWRSQVDDQFELGRQYDGQVARLLALENSAGVVAGLAIGIRSAGAVADQAAGFGLLAICVDCRHGKTCGQRNKLVAVIEEQGIGGDKKRADPILHNDRESIVNIAFGPDIEEPSQQRRIDLSQSRSDRIGA